jgi:hypothetical protein
MEGKIFEEAWKNRLSLRLEENETAIDLSENEISAEGAEHIAKVLKSNQTLKEIGLGTNNISEREPDT